MIEPDINIKEKFEQIDLACNRERRINNSINAPMKSLEQIHHEFILEQLKDQELKEQKSKAPALGKAYDTDTDNEEKKQPSQKQETKLSKQHQTDVNNILKQWGVSDINKLIGSGSEDESKRKKSPKKNQEEEK